MNKIIITLGSSFHSGSLFSVKIFCRVPNLFSSFFQETGYLWDFLAQALCKSIFRAFVFLMLLVMETCSKFEVRCETFFLHFLKNSPSARWKDIPLFDRTASVLSRAPI